MRPRALTLAAFTAAVLARCASAEAPPDLRGSYDKAMRYVAAGDLKRAAPLLEDGLGLAEAARDDSAVVAFAGKLAEAEEGLGSFDAAAAHWWRASEVARSHKDELQEDYFLVRFGEASLQRRPPNFEAAERICGQAREKLLNAGFEPGLVRALQCLARAKEAQGDLEASRFYREEGLDLYPEAAGAPNRVQNLIGLAELQAAFGDNEKAEEYLNRARAQARSVQSDALALSVEEAAADLDRKAGRLTEARRGAEFSLSERTRLGLPLTPAKLLEASVDLAEGRADAAAEVFKEFGDPIGLGRAELELKKFDEAERAYREALDKSRSFDETSEASIGLAKAYAGAGRSRASEEVLKEACKELKKAAGRLTKRHRRGYGRSAGRFFAREEACR